MDILNFKFTRSNLLKLAVSIVIALIVLLVFVVISSFYRFSGAVSSIATSVVSQNSQISLEIRNGEAANFVQGPSQTSSEMPRNC